jgi:hypothetical protein
VLNDDYGESSEISEETVAIWVSKFPSIMIGYKPKEMANRDEVGLFLWYYQAKFCV